MAGGKGIAMPQDVKIAIVMCAALMATVALVSPYQDESGVSSPSQISLVSEKSVKPQDQPPGGRLPPGLPADTWQYASGDNVMVKAAGQSTNELNTALLKSGCKDVQYDRKLHQGWSSGNPTSEESKCDEVLNTYAEKIGMSGLMEWLDSVQDAGGVCDAMTHSGWPDSTIPYKCHAAPPDGGYWFGASTAEQTQYGNWAHRFGALAAEIAKKHSKPQWGIEATTANLIEHHGIHGSMWTVVTETKSHHKAWKLHGDNTMFVKFNDFHMWIDACHGVGHAMTFFAPNGPMDTSKQITLSDAAGVCMGQPYDDWRCSACCMDGIFHESSAAALTGDWAGATTVALPDDLKDLEPDMTDSIKACMGVGDQMPFFCYRWVNFETLRKKLALKQHGLCAIIAGGSGSRLRAIQGANLVQMAGCLGAQMGIYSDISTSPDAYTYTKENSDCEDVLPHSYGLWLSCVYGHFSSQAHDIFDYGGYAPQHRPELYGAYIQPVCKGFDDELAKLICETEIFDGFSGSSLMANATFLEATNKPLDEVKSATHSSKARQWAIDFFTTYIASLQSNPNARPW